MAKLNKLYRAFIDYRKVTAVDSDLKRDRKSYKLIDKELEYFEAIKVKCTIEEDWVKEIEKKMEYVTKAVNEERQFIETIGEVVPIEKVKKVSKDSVKHLAKHSNLITKVPENEDEIIPEKLYMVEKISDYTVYENIEELAPILISQKRKIYKGVSPNVDFYSGFVYDMLGIPEELYTAIFAIARIVGWSAHRIEELVCADKIIRPSYLSIMEEN